MDSDKLYRVKKEDIPKLERLLTVCFAKDPLYCKLIPDEDTRKRLLPGTEHAVATFEEDGYVSATGVTESRFSYAQIVAVAETARYFVFALSSHHTQAYDKRNIRGGSVEDFRAFIAEKTGKLVEDIK